MINLKMVFKRARKIIEARYEDECDIIEYQDVYNNITKQTQKEEITVYEKQKCQLSFKTISNNSEVDSGTNKTQIVELFISPDIKIKPGSKIIVNHKGNKTVYKNSGETAPYNTQQTIILELFDKWS